MIQVKNLTKQFGNFTAVNNISFEIKAGEVAGLLGPNGAGKTTTMRMLTGFYNPTGGSIQIDTLSMPANRQAIQKKIGYLPESASSYADMTVWDFLQFAADARGLTSEDKAKGLEKSIAATGISEYLYHPIHKLSKGYKQRVGLASALVHDPSILILDEPTSGLDPNQIAEIQNLIRELSKDKTIILSSHILSEVEAVADRVLIIARGELAYDKSIADLKNQSQTTTLAAFRNAPENLPDILRESLSLAERPQSQMRDGETLFRIAGDKETSHRIFRAAAERNLELTEVYRETESLEALFRSITGGNK